MRSCPRAVIVGSVFCAIACVTNSTSHRTEFLIVVSYQMIKHRYPIVLRGVSVFMSCIDCILCHDGKCGVGEREDGQQDGVVTCLHMHRPGVNCMGGMLHMSAQPCWMMTTARRGGGRSVCHVDTILVSNQETVIVSIPTVRPYEFSRRVEELFSHASSAVIMDVAWVAHFQKRSKRELHPSTCTSPPERAYFFRDVRLMMHTLAWAITAVSLGC